MKIETMSKDERGLLLYFECQAVDYGGKIDVRRMNEIDMELAKEWDSTGFVRFGRIAACDIQKLPSHIFSHWCVLSDEAWTEAHRERRARNVRVEKTLRVYRNGYDQEEAA